eukprot:10840533-Prorocentrum_lima.AAC.1
MDPAGLHVLPLPHMNTPPRMSTPGASAHVPGHLGFSPAAATPQKSPGETHGWDPGQRAPSCGA